MTAVRCWYKLSLYGHSMFLSAGAVFAVANGRAPPRPRRLSHQPAPPQVPEDDLPAYSANPAYVSVPHPADVTRRVVKNHEKKVKKDLKEAQRAEVQCARIKKILPEIYAQLTAACDEPRVARERTGPAAFRQESEETGVEISFISRGIDQKALRQYLPILLADYQRQMEMAGTANPEPTTSTVRAQDPTLSRSVTAPELSHEDLADGEVRGDAEGPSRPALLHHSATTSQVRQYDPDRMSVTAGFFEGYTQKIYFSRKFANLWKKKENGKRENLASGIAMVLVGLKLGLPIFDLVTFAAIDCPRLALQGITGKQTLKLKD